MKIKINGTKYPLKRISELTVKEYSDVVSNLLFANVLTYISGLTGIDIKNCETESNIDLVQIEKILFDIDIDYQKLKMPNILSIMDKDIIVEELFNNTFETKYIFDHYRYSYSEKKITLIELYLYALAIMIEKKLYPEDEFNTEIHEEIVKNLMDLPWIKVIPIGFFLLKKSANKKNYLMMLSKSLINSFQALKNSRKLKKLKTRTI